MIKAVIFDMYETLISHFDTPLYFGSEMARDAGIEEGLFLKLWRSTEDDRTLGKITFEEVIEWILRENHCYSEEKFQRIVTKRRETKRACFDTVDEGVYKLLDELKARGIKIGLVSNCYSEEARVIRESKLMSYFDAVCLSFEEKVQKPDKVIFDRILSKLDVEPGESLYVGDGGSLELETATELGMEAVQALWYIKKGDPKQEPINPRFRGVEKPVDIMEIIVGGN